ncbi:uncharacterized protein LOC113226287 isoform X2 [Hyposmocoma kahamanoa]|uniref:uncharacterized protein LOC113226287 isoform X2 n=1 Tax=Hyposmocoma kahamanoa TaxID=1477025 RepID=UPI000E6D646D|nr:uncharacterized protein LOC113226287 isoform X2 [Hyposmocoma kahamanoa]
MHLVQVLTLFVFAFGYFSSVSAQAVVCPAVRTTSGWLDLFPLPCRKHAECRVMGTQHLCCKGFCTKGVKSASSATISTTTSTTTKRPTTEAPRPFLQLLPIQTTQTSAQKKQATTAVKTSKNLKYVCPRPGTAPILIFPLPCENNAQCRASNGPDQVCCEKRCVKGVPAPRPTSKPRTHQPLLGVIPRECPTTPLGELLFEVQTCKTDADCWPRVCCPDGKRSYCRTARARLDLVPIANQIDEPVRMFEQYLQCTAPPQLDLFPQRCTSSVDCFPNLCCAEGGKKHCRPPQRSLLGLLAGMTQRVGSTIGALRQIQAKNNKA